MTESVTLGELVRSTIALACNRPPEAITPDTELSALNIDSLTFAAVIAHVEATYELEFDPDNLISLIQEPRISDLVRRLETLVMDEGTEGVS